MKTPEDRAKYVGTINNAYGCHMTPEDITDNPGLRKISKDILNSLWGRLGLNSGKGCRESKIISHESELRKIMALPGVKIDDARIVSVSFAKIF